MFHCIHQVMSGRTVIVGFKPLCMSDSGRMSRIFGPIIEGCIYCSKEDIYCFNGYYIVQWVDILEIF